MVPAANADFLQTVGDGLKTAGTKTVELFNVGKDKVMSLFSGADPKKIPALIRKLQESQYSLHTKQQGLLELYGSSSQTSGSSRPIPDKYMQERANDLQIAWEDNQKQVNALKEMLAKCNEKKKDYSQYNSEISKVENTQNGLDKNQGILSPKLAKYLKPSSETSVAKGSDNGKSEDNPSGLSNDALAQRFDSADNPYSSAGVGRSSDTNDQEGDPSYEPGLSSEKPHASAPNSIDPNSGEVKNLINQWLSMKGLDPFGRLLGNGISAAGNPDTGGLTRETWLLSQLPELRKYVKAHLGQVSSTEIAGNTEKVSTSEKRPQSYVPQSSAAKSESSNVVSKASENSDQSRESLQNEITSGSGTTDEMKAKYEQYLANDKNRQEVLSQQHQAVSK